MTDATSLNTIENLNPKAKPKNTRLQTQFCRNLALHYAIAHQHGKHEIRHTEDRYLHRLKMCNSSNLALVKGNEG